MPQAYVLQDWFQWICNTTSKITILESKHDHQNVSRPTTFENQPPSSLGEILGRPLWTCNIKAMPLCQVDVLMILLKVTIAVVACISVEFMKNIILERLQPVIRPIVRDSAAVLKNTRDDKRTIFQSSLDVHSADVTPRKEEENSGQTKFAAESPEAKISKDESTADDARDHSVLDEEHAKVMTPKASRMPAPHLPNSLMLHHRRLSAVLPRSPGHHHAFKLQKRRSLSEISPQRTPEDQLVGGRYKLRTKTRLTKMQKEIARRDEQDKRRCSHENDDRGRKRSYSATVAGKAEE